MRRGGGVHTVPAGQGRGSWNTVDGRVLSRDPTRDVAVAAGREIAKELGVEHTIQRTDDIMPAKNAEGNNPDPEPK